MIHILGALLLVSLALLALSLRRLVVLHRVRNALLLEKDVAYGFLHDVGDVFAETDPVNLDVLLERILYYAQRTTKGGAGALYLVEQNGEILRARAVAGIFPPIDGGLPPEAAAEGGKLPLIEKAVRAEKIRTGKGIIGGVAASGAPLLIRNPELDSRLPRLSIEFLEIHSMLLVPMRFRENILGVLAVINRVDGVAFTENDKNLLQAMADQASVSIHYMRQSAALDEKRQMDRDLAIAREIQTALLPTSLPSLPELRIAAFSDPAREIGGDYYDVFKVDDGHLGMVIADVSGKGISGAIVMAICRSMIRSNANGNLSPASVLKAANAAIGDGLPEGIFVSVLYMIYDIATRETRVARAGHLQPIICRRDRDDPRIIESEGMAIGISDNNSFDETIEETKVVLQSGDTLFAYTDGITEAMNESGEEWSSQNLIKAVQTTVRAGGTAEEVARDVQRQVLEFVGKTPQYDDMTFLATQVK